MDADARNFLQRDLIPPIAGTSLSFTVHRHAVEHDREGERRLELLQGDAEDFQAFQVDVRSRAAGRRRHDIPGVRVCAARMGD